MVMYLKDIERPALMVDKEGGYIRYHDDGRFMDDLKYQHDNDILAVAKPGFEED